MAGVTTTCLRGCSQVQAYRPSERFGSSPGGLGIYISPSDESLPWSGNSLRQKLHFCTWLCFVPGNAGPWRRLSRISH